MLTVLVACKEEKTPGGLEFIGEHRVLYSTLPDWAEAANALLAQAQAIGDDAIFCDDDVTFTEQSMAGVRRYYAAGDLFGFDLHDLTGARQEGARHGMAPDGALLDWVHPGPAYVAHCSTSAMYIKANALSLRFPEWPGIYWEDVALCIDAWLHGFKVLAVPGYVHHDIVQGSGATKRHTAAFWERWQTNKTAFERWCGERDMRAVPIGAQEL